MSLRDIALPGESHPAVERYKQNIRDAHGHRNIVKVAILKRVNLQAFNEGDPTSTINKLIFRRKEAWQSLDLIYGAYVWSYWVDQYGRMITIDDRAEWIPNPDAIMYGEYNPEVKK